MGMEKDVFAEIEFGDDGSEQRSNKQDFDKNLSKLPHLRNSYLDRYNLTPDPIRQRFFDMRSLASDNPSRWREASLFYKQAKFMVDFSDDYQSYESLSMRAPTFQRLGYDRLRTYFTWRTKVRNGEYPSVDVSYVFLYVYELLMVMGVAGPADARHSLINLWNAYKDQGLDLKGFLPVWLMDFHIYYGMEHEFLNFASEHDLLEYYSENLLFEANEECCLRWWNKASSYNIDKSTFYNSSEDNASKMKKCFYAVINDMDTFFKSKHTSLQDIITHTEETMRPWHHFRGAVFHKREHQPDRTVKMPGGAIYELVNDFWCTYYRIPYSYRKLIVGFLIKQTESQVRKFSGYKTALKSDISILYTSESCVRIIDYYKFEPIAIIQQAVQRCFNEYNRIVVNVDHSNLVRIREEADVITDKLVVQDEEGTPTGDLEAQQTSDNAEPQVNLHLSSDSFGTFGDTLPEVNNQWVSFIRNLTAIEYEALQVIIKSPSEYKTFSASRNVMPEILADSINEKAFETIGDNIMEMDDTPVVYEEYKDAIINAVSFDTED